MPRGIPNERVLCSVCQTHWASKKKGVCPYCSNLKDYHRSCWSPEHDAILLREYQSCSSRREITKAVNFIIKATGRSRNGVRCRASQLGISFGIEKKLWTNAEEELLERWAGEVSATKMARRLSRAVGSVVCKLSRMGISGKVIDGSYDKKLFAELIGVSWATVTQWERRGFIRRDEKRFTEASVVEFITNHSSQFDLRRVDQVWFKNLMFRPITVGEVLRSTQSNSNSTGATQ